MHTLTKNAHKMHTSIGPHCRSWMVSYCVDVNKTSVMRSSLRNPHSTYSMFSGNIHQPQSIRACDLLDRAWFRPVDRHEIVKEKSVEELNAQLVSLVGENRAEMLISAFKSNKSISGPELTG